MAYYKIIKLNLEEEYQPEIRGLGEIYEKMSVFYLQKKLIKKFKRGILFLSSNKEHRGRGLSLEEMRFYVKKRGYQILTIGFTDSPPWVSSPKKSTGKENRRLVILAKAIFWFLVRLEFLWRGEQRSHMVFCFTKKDILLK